MVHDNLNTKLVIIRIILKLWYMYFNMKIKHMILAFIIGRHAWAIILMGISLSTYDRVRRVAKGGATQITKPPEKQTVGHRGTQLN